MNRQREVVPKGGGANVKCPYTHVPAMLLSLGTNKVIPLFDLSGLDGSDVASRE